MGQIQQLQMSFVPLEDRILFRINVAGRSIAQFRFWITRRYARVMWQGLTNMVKSRHAKSQPEPAPDAPTEAGELAVEHQQKVADADFETQFQEAATYPLGDDPILLSRVSVRNDPNRGQILCLHPEKGQGLETSLDDKMLHSVCKLLYATVAKADWDLQLKFVEPDQETESGGLN